VHLGSSLCAATAADATSSAVLSKVASAALTAGSASVKATSSTSVGKVATTSTKVTTTVGLSLGSAGLNGDILAVHHVRVGSNSGLVAGWGGKLNKGAALHGMLVFTGASGLLKEGSKIIRRTLVRLMSR
jgi:hypothetical protein